MISKTPTYNLKAVMKETELGADTLRAWERRYGLPSPQRSSGRHRLYSEYDIATIKWLVARQNEGLRISRAVDLFNELISQGNDPVLENQPTQPTPTMVISGSRPIENIRSDWLSACKGFDETKAEQILTQAFALYSPEIVCTEVLQKGLAQIGNEWYIGEATVQQEHFTSALANRRINALIANAPLPTRSHRVIVACPPNENHTFAPSLISLFLRRRGIAVNYLGADVPIARLLQTVEEINPNLVIFSAQLLKTAATLKETAEILSASDIPIAFGGRIFNVLPKIRDRIPGIYLGETIADAMAVIENSLSVMPKINPPKSYPNKYQELIDNFILLRSAIEAEVYLNHASLGIPFPILNQAINEIGDAIKASLILGDISFANVEISWLVEMLKHKNRDQNLVTPFLNLYAQAAQKYLGSDGKIVSEWLVNVNGD